MPNRFNWLSDYLSHLADADVRVRQHDVRSPPAQHLILHPNDWEPAARIAAELGARHAGIWADPLDTPADLAADNAEPRLRVMACLERDGAYLLLETEVPLHQPHLVSHAPHFPGISRLERHAHDLTGVIWSDAPDTRRWTRHQAWPEERFPLRADYPVNGETSGRTLADADYPFLAALGGGSYEVPVGPVHAGVIEPGHFRFQAMGEDVLRLETRLGYVHRGVEKLAVGRDPLGLARLAGRVSGDSTVAHTWAACQALERACGCEVPLRALALRALLAERERIANHLGDIGAICNDVGFAFALAQCSRVRELWQRRSHELFGHRLLMDVIIPGGVAADLSAAGFQMLRQDHAALRQALEPIFGIVEDLPSLDDRLLTTGRLTAADARALGCTGYVGKASGLAFDVRRDSPYPPYERLRVEVPIQTEGDVAARMRVRIGEVRGSLWMLERLLDDLPVGDIHAPLPTPVTETSGLGLIDGWRGEVLSFVRLDAAGRIARYFPRDPSWFTWPALERLILGNIVPDFPVCNKSVNGSYAGHDL